MRKVAPLLASFLFLSLPDVRMLTRALCASFVFLCLSGSLTAQGNNRPSGEYTGMLLQFRVKLHMHTSADGSLSATVDSPDANLFDMPCTNFSLNGAALSFNVPVVKGTWSGVVSADGNSLSGIWMQGNQGPQAQPHPLNFARGTGSVDSGASAVQVTQQPVPVHNTQQSGSQCPLGSIANYWDGATWKPLRTPELLNGERGFSIHEAMKNPLNNMRGNTIVFKYKGVESATVVPANTRFCFTVATNMTAQYLLGSLDVKQDHREIEYTQSNRGSEGWLPAKRQRPISSQRASDTLILITPNDPLPPGQYIIGSSQSMVYDMTVR